MRRIVLFLILGIMFVASVQAVNQMQIMQTFIGESNNSYFGKKMTTLDFNADGIDDLVIRDRTGKIFVYYGGEGAIDIIPDLTVTGNYLNNLLTAGDVNGDGYDDLLTVEDLPNDYYQDSLVFFYGGPNADLVPDKKIYMHADNMQNLGLEPVECLGDINNDGFDDIGCIKRTEVTPSYFHKNLYILLGGTFEEVPVIENVSGGIHCLISSMGDVNGDGLDDFMVGYAPNTYPDPEDLPRYRYIYYGSNGVDLTNRVLLMESNIINEVFPGGYSIGDFNGDGCDDFITADKINEEVGYIHFKMGSSSLPESQEYVVTQPEYMNQVLNINFRGVAFGDFNGDGYSDVVGTNYIAEMWSGLAGIWLGKAQPNGLYDLWFRHPTTSPYHQFGWAVTTGDYNHDGYCDIAISAPNSQSGDPNYPGKVYIYAGNPELIDTTVAINDQVEILKKNITLNIFPNPAVKGKSTLKYQILGQIPKKTGSAWINIYNIKGQVVTKQTVSLTNSKQNTGNILNKKMKTGIYLAALYIDNKRVTTQKITVK